MSSFVITGLGPVISIGEAPHSSDRNGRDRPGHDVRAPYELAQVAASRRMKASPASSWSSVMYSSGWCA